MPAMTVTGTLVAESLRDDAVVADVTLRVGAVVRVAAGDPTAGQPLVWTLLELEADDGDLDVLVARLAAAVRPGPWYCDLRTDTETVVVFADRVFRYARGDAAGRAAAEAHARSSGVPRGQIDWPD